MRVCVCVCLINPTVLLPHFSRSSCECGRFKRSVCCCYLQTWPQINSCSYLLILVLSGCEFHLFLVSCILYTRVLLLLLFCFCFFLLCCCSVLTISCVAGEDVRTIFILFAFLSSINYYSN